ncbi:MAG: YceI family protein [candidate division Zixibacteria bacterium]|nr:YceI family protein [candidate division Zixibacteria bacterium]
MLKRITTTFIILMLLTSVSFAQKWNFDVPHSTISFSVKHLVISKTTGKFDDYSGFVMFDGKNFEKGKAEVTIQMSSINTDNSKRDDHLRSVDFFNVEKFPTMTFLSKKISKTKGDKFKMTGDLTIKGVTKEVTLDCTFNGAAEFMGDTRAGFTAHTVINRQDFNIAWENKMKDGSLIVGNDVEINLEIELVKEK